MRAPAQQHPTAQPRASARRPQRKGFTLVELLVVVAIIALLVTILLPTLSRALELTRRTICATNLAVMGRAWNMYFQEYNGRTPYMFNDRPGVTDCISQFNFIIWTCTDGSFCNAGKLYEHKFLGSETAWVCPTVAKNVGGSWFNSDNIYHYLSWGSWKNNPWPPVDWGGHHVFMTYGTRRMRWYDDRSLAVENGHNDTRDDDIMIWSAGVSDIRQPANFSFMADNFCLPDIALLSHVPGVNVLYLDGHVSYFEDTTEKILYDNKIVDWHVSMNWLHDKIWMDIDEND